MLKRRKPGATDAGRDAAQGPAIDYEKLRGAVLGVEPGSLGLAPTADLPHVYGLVMDTSYATGTATVVVLAEGTTSLYTSTGAGLVGAGGHEGVAAASRNLLQTVEASLDAFGPGSGEVPAAGRVAMIALTHDGTRRVEATEGELAQGDHAGSPVYHATQMVVAALRSAT